MWGKETMNWDKGSETQEEGNLRNEGQDPGVRPQAPRKTGEQMHPSVWEYHPPQTKIHGAPASSDEVFK